MSTAMNGTKFQNIDLGTGLPTSIPMEVIDVQIGVDDMIGDYARSFVQEAYRVAPLRAQQVELTEEEVTEYCRYLLVKRIETVKGDCKDFRRLKILVMPAFIQYVLTLVGRVVKYDIGITLMPSSTYDTSMTLEQAIMISSKIAAFQDCLVILEDAMPRDIDGNSDVMSTALIAGYVRAMKKVEHPISTYVTAFLGMKLQQETAFQALYRVRYDDVEFIRQALTSQKGLF
jgi:hypothetical protein